MISHFGSTTFKQRMGVTDLSHISGQDFIGTRAVTEPQHEKNFTASSASLARATPSARESIEERLFDAKADAKIYTQRVQVAMRIDETRRRQLYRQIDSILDVDEWMEGNEPLNVESYQTFIRYMFVNQHDVRPGLGLTSEGNLIAMWQTSDARLTLYCLAGDELRYVISHVVDGKRRTAAGDAAISDLQNIIAPFQPDRWFDREPA